MKIRQIAADTVGTRRIRRWSLVRATVVFALVATLGSFHVWAQSAAQQDRMRVQQDQSVDRGDLHVLQVRDHIYMVVTPVGNITVQVGDEILLVDTGTATVTERLVATIKQLSAKPIRYVINTSADDDRTGGNEGIVKATDGVRAFTVAGGGESVGVEVISHENALNRLMASTGAQPRVPVEALPISTFFGEKKNLFVDGEGIQIVYQPSAHTDGDVIVYFRRSDVVSAGNVFNTASYPIIDTQHGGTIQGMLDALNGILDITIPERNEQDGTLVIPGHGRLCNQAEVVEYRDMATIIRDRILNLVKKGMTLEQVRAAAPTLDYDGVYGASAGPWTTDMFIAAVYRTVGQQKR